MAKVTLSDGSRYYTWPSPDGSITERYTSVTTIIDGGIPKQQVLTKWAAKLVAQTAVEDAEIVLAFKQKGPQGIENAIEHLKGAPYRKSEKAKDLGGEIHEVIEAWALGKPMPPASAEAKPYIERFLDLFVAFSPVIEQTEAAVYNRSRRYAGTLDGIGVFDGSVIVQGPKYRGKLPPPVPFRELFRREGIELPDNPRLLFDVKTGKGTKRHPVYPEAGLQMAAYARAEFIAGPDGEEVPMPAVDGACVFHLQPDYAEIVPVRIDEDVFRSFLYCREIFRWQEEIAKTVIGKPVSIPVAKTSDDSSGEPSNSAQEGPEAVEGSEVCGEADCALDAGHRGKCRPTRPSASEDRIKADANTGAVEPPPEGSSG